MTTKQKPSTKMTTTTSKTPSKKKAATEAARAAQVAKLEEMGVIDAQDAPEAPTVAEEAPAANPWATFFGTHEPRPSFDPASVTLKDLSEGFVIHLEHRGKSAGTRMSYLMDLGVALKALGEHTRVQDLTEEQVTTFFESATLTKTRSGASKAKVSIDKTRRVFRQAMDFAVEKGVIAESPVAQVYRIRRGKEDA